MREHHDRLARRASPQIVLEPFELRLPELPEPAGAQVGHVVQADEVHASLVEAVPSSGLRAAREALEEGPAVIHEHVVLAGHVVRVEPGAAHQPFRGVELRRAREVADIAGVDQQLRRAAMLAQQADRLLQRRGRIGVRAVGKADMAVADLHEGEIAGRRRLRRFRATDEQR